MPQSVLQKHFGPNLNTNIVNFIEGGIKEDIVLASTEIQKIAPLQPKIEIELNQMELIIEATVWYQEKIGSIALSWNFEKMKAIYLENRPYWVT